MIQFHPLASSSAGCCYKVSAPGAGTLLIDAGVRIDLIKKALSYKLSEIAGCLVSHGHGDHCKAVKEIIGSAIDVYATPETWMSPQMVWSASSHYAQTISPRVPFYVGGWTVKAFEAVHDQPGTVGFLLKAPQQGGTLLYLTDSAYSLFTFEEDLTHIAIEVNYDREILRQNTASGEIGGKRYSRLSFGHMEINTAIDMLKKHEREGHLKKLEEIHLLHLSAQNSDEAAFKARFEREFGVPVYVAPVSNPAVLA